MPHVPSKLPGAFSAVPPHLILRNFLGAEFAATLLDAAEARAGAFRQSRVHSKPELDLRIRTSVETRELGALRSRLEERFREALALALEALGLSIFSLSDIDIQLVAHGNGAFYTRHIDSATHGVRASDRLLTGVYYFHSLPKRFTGGALRLHSIAPAELGGCYVDIEPENDSYLLFPSWAPHEVRPVACPSDRFRDARFSINCWYLRERS